MDFKKGRKAIVDVLKFDRHMTNEIEKEVQKAVPKKAWFRKCRLKKERSKRVELYKIKNDLIVALMEPVEILGTKNYQKTVFVEAQGKPVEIDSSFIQGTTK